MSYNRGKLKREVEKGLMEGRLGFHIEHDDATYDRFGKKSDSWLPVKLIKGNEEFEEGKINLRPWQFTSKSGRAYKGSDDVIHFGAHSNELIYLRKRKR